MSWRCLPHCRGDGDSFDKKSTRRPRRLGTDKVSLCLQRSLAAPDRQALEATVKHLKVAATVVSLAIVSLSISCGSVPPTPTKSRNVPAVAGHAALAPHLPDAVANGKAPMLNTVSLQQRLQLALQLPLRNQPELT